MRFYVENNNKKIYLNTPIESPEALKKKYGKNFKINGKIYSTKDVKYTEISTSEANTIIGSTIGGIIAGPIGSLIVGSVSAIILGAKGWKHTK